MKAKTLLIAILSLSFLILIISLLFMLSDRQGKTAVQVSIFPRDASMTIDGNTITEGTTYLKPGTYMFEASKEGFDDHSQVVVIEEGADQKIIAPILNPNTEETLEWAKENDTEYERVFAEAQEAAAEIGKTFNERNPIAKHLPYKTSSYSVGYRMDQNDPSGNSIIIEIDANDGYRQSAIYRIRQLGYDPTDFTINFRDYENPFPL